MAEVLRRLGGPAAPLRRDPASSQDAGQVGPIRRRRWACACFGHLVVDHERLVERIPRLRQSSRGTQLVTEVAPGRREIELVVAILRVVFDQARRDLSRLLSDASTSVIRPAWRWMLAIWRWVRSSCSRFRVTAGSP